MRQRGADCTDIVVLVVAADEGVKEQTLEALNSAKSAGKAVIVCFNKVDKESADVMRVATQLTEHGILVEFLGGEVLSAEVSAKERRGIDGLLEKILLQAEVLELRANPECAASGFVLEARVDKGVGGVATTLIQRGTLRVGDEFIAGEARGKVKSLLNDRGERVLEAGPGTPVQVRVNPKLFFGVCMHLNPSPYHLIP
jgi:translation initiation factor IF-2